MQLVNLKARLTITDPDIGRAIHTTYWTVEVSQPTHIVEICRQITAKLVGPSAWSNAWCLVLPRGCFLTRFQIGPAAGGFYVDQRLGGIDFEGTRLLILFPGLQKSWVNSRISWIPGFNRQNYSQIPFIWKHDFTDDRIWEPYFVLLSQTAATWLSDFVTSAGDTFYFVCRSHDFLFQRPFDYRVERVTSRQLHRRPRQ